MRQPIVFRLSRQEACVIAFALVFIIGIIAVILKQRYVDETQRFEAEMTVYCIGIRPSGQWCSEWARQAVADDRDVISACLTLPVGSQVSFDECLKNKGVRPSQ